MTHIPIQRQDRNDSELIRCNYSNLQLPDPNGTTQTPTAQSLHVPNRRPSHQQTLQSVPLEDFPLEPPKTQPCNRPVTLHS